MTEAASLFISLDAQVRGELVSQQVLHLLEHHWGHSVGTAPRRTITLVHGALPAVPDAPPLDILVARTSLQVWAAGDELWLSNELHFGLQGQDVQLTFGAVPVSGEAWLLAFTEAHRAAGWLPLHAAVLMQAGRGVALAGVSGAGKSTAALRLAAAGVTVLSEDHTWVHPQSRLTVGLDQYLRTFDDSLQAFAPQWLAADLGRDPHGKRTLPLTQPGEQTTLNDLLVFGLLPVPSPAHKVRALWETVGVPLTQTGRRATAAGINALFPYLTIAGVDRENVVSEVQQRLKAPSPPATVPLPEQ
ncbi:hypothetical protein [Deinococcus aquatilis]|uniref:hypothetical protein n=1 Tax=Deinococcus aquatilis TaxID=519440 RepID=UPI000361FE88|nr:hypothetical protein [Deinococcus aquatilis]